MKTNDEYIEGSHCSPPTVSGQIEHVVMTQAISDLEDLLKIQCGDGNWNYDPYMQGMANGMILAMSLFKGVAPEFLDAPEVWGKDSPYVGAPVEGSVAS